MGKKKKLKEKIKKWNKRYLKEARKVEKLEAKLKKQTEVCYHAGDKVYDLKQKLEELEIGDDVVEFADEDDADDDEATEAEDGQSDETEAEDKQAKFAAEQANSVAGVILMVIAIAIALLAVVAFSQGQKKRDAADYFVEADNFGKDGYYKNLTPGQKITNLRVFKFKEYLRSRQGLLGYLHPSVDEVGYSYETEEYSRSDDVGFSYSLFIGDVWVSIGTRVSDESAPKAKEASETDVWDKLPRAHETSETKEPAIVSYISVSFDDGEGNDVYVHSEKSEVEMADAVFDNNSPFFCSRETFEVLVALLESGRLKKYPNNPFVGLLDEAAPDDYQSELLKSFLPDLRDELGLEAEDGSGAEDGSELDPGWSLPD